MRITDLTPLARGGGAGVPPNQAQQRPLTARGKVEVAPTSTTDSMRVTLNAMSHQHGWVEIPPGNWLVKELEALPAVGTTCLVIFDDVGDAWVPLWH